MIGNKHVTKLLFTLTISLLLTALLVTSSPAVKKWRESKIGGGWQIWISAADFDRSQGFKRGKEVPIGQPLHQQIKEVPQPFLGGDILIATEWNGFAEYDFESSQQREERKAFIFCRVMDLQGGGKSWAVEGLVINTPAAWQWETDNKGALNKKLKKGLNTIRIQSREAGAGARGAGPGGEALMDVFMVSTKFFQPTDKHYKQAQKLAVEPAGKLTITWAALKNHF